MTAWSNSMWAGDRSLNRRQVRRLSRRFAGVGVGIPAARLHEIAAGRPATEDELFDVNFALAANQMLGEERRAKRGRAQRRCVHWLIVSGAILVALNLLLCLGLVFFTLAQHTSPY
jgi:hypothetical protein